MSVVCEDIPNTEDVRKALYSDVPSLVRVHYTGESQIPGIDATKLAPCVLPVFYKQYANEIEAFKVYADDIWVTSFPRCGTTWTQEMVWLLANDLDYGRAKNSSITSRYGFLERSAILTKLYFGVGDKNTVEIARALPRPRFIKSHLPIALLPTEFWIVKPKLVYVTRNPKDAAISYYHHYVNLHQYKRSLKDFMDSYLKGLVCWSPFCDHVLDYWKLRNEPNILFITYEDMSKDLMDVIQRVAKFLDKTYTDEQYNQLAKHLSFDEMKNNWAVNYEDIMERVEQLYGKKGSDSNFKFFRRGQLNSANEEMPVEYQKKFDDWLDEAFKESDFKFNI